MLKISNANFHRLSQGRYRVLIARFSRKNKGFEGRVMSISEGVINEDSLVKIRGRKPEEKNKTTVIVRIICLKNCCEIIRRLKEVL